MRWVLSALALSLALVTLGPPARSEGLLVARQLSNAVQQFLGASIRYYGHIDRDPNVVDSVQAQRPLMSSEIESPATDAYRRLARRVAQWIPPTIDRGAAVVRTPPFVTVDELARTEARSCA